MRWRPLRMVLACALVLGVAGAVIWHVQRTLRAVEEGLPAAVVAQERAIMRVLASLEDLSAAIGQARAAGLDDLGAARAALERAEAQLAAMRQAHGLDNLVGAATVHAMAMPALLDLRLWLDHGINGLPPETPLVLALSDRRAGEVVARARQHLDGAQEAALGLLGQQAEALSHFRHGMVAIIGVIAALALLSIVLALRHSRAQGRVEDALRAAKTSAEEASRAKSQFLATMSHELRTPLNAIIGFSEIIRDGVLGPAGVARYSEYARDIHQSGLHLLSLINDVLELAKVESGKYELTPRRLRLHQLAETCLRILEPRAHKGGVAMANDIAPELDAVEGDERAVRQILLNLLSNAVKFTPAGGRVRVALHRASPGFVTVEVSDTGIGIPAEKIAAALTPFEQVDSGMQRRYEGTGLGLPLAKSLVELHGGSLRITSQPGIGTTVSVDLPAARAAPDGAASPAAAESVAAC